MRHTFCRIFFGRFLADLQCWQRVTHRTRVAHVSITHTNKSANYRRWMHTMAMITPKGSPITRTHQYQFLARNLSGHRDDDCKFYKQLQKGDAIVTKGRVEALAAP
jgi:hypothetical protein